MTYHLRGLWAAALLTIFLTCPVRAQEEMVANPYYKFWSGAKPGATAIHLEQTKLAGPEGKLVADGVDEKRITYKLAEINDDRVVVEMVVTERDFLGYVQAAPTRYIYPAKLKKTHLERVLKEIGAKTGEDSVKVDGKDVKCRTVTGSTKGANGEEIDYKLWLCDDVPGSVVKQVRTTKQKGELVAETTTLLQSHK
jgi:hypothetical protein